MAGLAADKDRKGWCVEDEREWNDYIVLTNIESCLFEPIWWTCVEEAAPVARNQGRCISI